MNGVIRMGYSKKESQTAREQRTSRLTEAQLRVYNDCLSEVVWQTAKEMGTSTSVCRKLAKLGLALTSVEGQEMVYIKK
jgi:hypothetical protein